MDADAIVAEMNRAAADFRAHLDNATSTDLHRRSNGTRWSNEQLLFHMLFGYLIVRTLLPLVRLLAHCPDGLSRGFAALLNAATRPFHMINYLGSLGGARILGHSGMLRVMDRVTAGLTRSLHRRSSSSLARGMHFPTGWDPYFRDYMTLSDVYHYATQHYDHHRRQLTLPNADKLSQEGLAGGSAAGFMTVADGDDGEAQTQPRPTA
jgi:DinB superfamily